MTTRMFKCSRKKGNSSSNIVRNKTTDSLDILEEIQRNNIREHKVDQALKKEDSLAWEQDGIVYIEGHTFQITGRLKNKFYKRTMILQISAI